LGKDAGTCCKAKASVEMLPGAPKIRKKKSDSDGVVTVTFDQMMEFSEDWVKMMNDRKARRRTKQLGLTVIY